MGSIRLQVVNLPDAPGCMNPVDVPKVALAQDARVALARHRSALRNANGRLVCSREFYDGVKERYAKQ